MKKISLHIGDEINVFMPNLIGIFKDEPPHKTIINATPKMKTRGFALMNDKTAYAMHVSTQTVFERSESL